ncbi:hypothetical protein H5410_022511 [Solanum commersonii]|uniref:Uncharacterized protein n=1 Tax=Solanum commersonii TaxID=4109 RepID=A0A9J5ZJD9_SOLCO|nr:hypothetical protein H5410_022511 [Solanum commersonii]
MRKFWSNWRGSLHKNMKSKSLHEVLNDVPIGVDRSDCEWLVKEHFYLICLTNQVQETKSTGLICVCLTVQVASLNERLETMMVIHQTWQPSSLRLLKREMSLSNLKQMKNMYAEIEELVQLELSLNNIEVVEQCFGPQCQIHVVGFCGGITTKELKGGSTSKDAFLEELKTTRKEKESLQKRMDILEKLVQLELSLNNIEVVEQCFGPQCKIHVVGFFGGITTKELKGGSTSKDAFLEELKTTRKEKESLQKRMDILESKYDPL